MTLLTVPEVATELAVSRKTVYQNWRAWGLTPVRIGGGTTGAVRFRSGDVDRLMTEWAEA